MQSCAKRLSMSCVARLASQGPACLTLIHREVVWGSGSASLRCLIGLVEQTVVLCSAIFRPNPGVDYRAPAGSVGSRDRHRQRDVKSPPEPAEKPLSTVYWGLRGAPLAVAWANSRTRQGCVRMAAAWDSTEVVAQGTMSEVRRRLRYGL